MSRLPIPHFINQIKTKLGFDRTLTASGEDVVDAVNKQSDEITNLTTADTALQAAGAIIVEGDTATQTVPAGGYAYIKNNTHGLTEGLYRNKTAEAFPVTGGTANSTVFEFVSSGGFNSFVPVQVSIADYLYAIITGNVVELTYNAVDGIQVQAGSYSYVAYVPENIRPFGSYSPIGVASDDAGNIGFAGIQSSDGRIFIRSKTTTTYNKFTLTYIKQ